jgi:S-(hydroxymethyl)glutathione dehydrogenase/alcohol dehydrogenase
MNRLRGVLYDGTSRLTRRNGTPLAMYSMGGLAQYAVVPVTDVFRLPDSLPLEDACILGCAVMTAYGAVCHQAEIKPGESVAVVGVGGIGSNVIQFAQLFGAGEIIAVDVRDEKLAAARALGATRTINATHGDPATLVRELTSNRGVDCAFEALGRPETALQAFSMARDGGRAVLIGVANGSAAVQIPITQLVRRGIRLIGSYGGRVRTDIPQLIRLLETGRLDISRTISRRFQLSKVNDAFRALENGEIVGRALIAMN